MLTAFRCWASQLVGPNFWTLWEARCSTALCSPKLCMRPSMWRCSLLYRVCISWMIFFGKRGFTRRVRKKMFIGKRPYHTLYRSISSSRIFCCALGMLSSSSNVPYKDYKFRLKNRIRTNCTYRWAGIWTRLVCSEELVLLLDELNVPKGYVCKNKWSKRNLLTAFAFVSLLWEVDNCSLRTMFSSWSLSKRALTSSGTSLPLIDARKSLYI